MYSIPNFNQALSNKTFYKADQVQLFWNDLGTNLLVLTQTDVDKTGKSYYGGKLLIISWYLDTNVDNFSRDQSLLFISGRQF